MFTGIIQKISRVSAAEHSASELRLRIDSGFPEVSLGESISVNGVCLTVTERAPDGKLSFYVSPETLLRSNLGALQAGSEVNLERALLASDRLSGHIVQGHIDGQAVFLGATPQGDGHEIALELPESVARFCIEKGSIALNGVSLTLNQVEGRKARVFLVPHTWENTNLSKLRPGDRVNAEADVLAKYVAGGMAAYIQNGFSDVSFAE